MKAEHIVSLIGIRNYLTASIEDTRIKLSREQLKDIHTRIQYLDKTIIENSLRLDLTQMDKGFTGKELSFKSTDNTEDVMKRYFISGLPTATGPIGSTGENE